MVWNVCLLFKGEQVTNWKPCRFQNVGWRDTDGPNYRRQIRFEADAAVEWGPPLTVVADHWMVNVDGWGEVVGTFDGDQQTIQGVFHMTAPSVELPPPVLKLLWDIDEDV